MHLSHPQDALKAIVQHHEKLDRLPFKARMDSVDSKGLTISFQRLTSFTNPRGWQQVTVPFGKPLSSESEARPKIIEMYAEAERRRNKKPKVLYSFNYGVLPLLAVFAGYYVLNNPQYLPEGLADRIINTVGGQKTLEKFNFVVEWAGLAHVVEATAMLLFSLYRGSSLLVALKWSVSTLISGFPQFFRFSELNPAGPTKGAKTLKAH